MEHSWWGRRGRVVWRLRHLPTETCPPPQFFSVESLPNFGLIVLLRETLVRSMARKYQRSGVSTRGSSLRRISKLCNLSRVEAELENLRIEVKLLDLESNIELLAEFF